MKLIARSTVQRRAKAGQLAFTRIKLPALTKRRHLAFTLVELLVVIGIIAVLMGILIPVLGKAQRSARNLKCLSNLRQIGGAFMAYAGANRGYLPAPQAIQLTPYWLIPWQVTLWQFLVKNRPIPDAELASGKHEYLKSTVFACPSGVLDKETGNYMSVGYAMNTDLLGSRMFAIGPSSQKNEYKKLNVIRRSSNVILASDGTSGFIDCRSAGDKDAMMVLGGGINSFDEITHPSVQNRHPYGYVQVLFVDGSAAPKQWIKSDTEIPVPAKAAPLDPASYPEAVQLFWYGGRTNAYRAGEERK